MNPNRTLSLDQVSVSYGPNRIAVNAVDLQIASGEVVSLLGPSGSGKSSLLRAIAGLEPVSGGTIRFDQSEWSSMGSTLAPEKRRCGVVFQDYALFPHLTALQNVAFGLTQLKGRERHDRAREILAGVELADRQKAYPHELSGGEQQRVALARALAPRPVVMLLDEPFSGLDRRLRTDLRLTTIEALRSAGAASLVVTHDAEEAMTLADRVALMHDGKIIQVGPPDEVYLKPASLRAARIMGEVVTFSGVVQDQHVDTPLGRIQADGQSDGAPVHVLVRPEGIQLSNDGVTGTIKERFVLTGYVDLLVTLNSGKTLTARVTLDSQQKAGDEVHLRLLDHYVNVVPAG